MAGLTREQIASASDRSIVEVEVPEWGGSVYLRTLRADELVDWAEVAGKDENNISLQWCTLLVRMLCDSDGNKLYDPSPESAQELGQRHSGVLAKLYKQAVEMSGMRSLQDSALD